MVLNPVNTLASCGTITPGSSVLTMSTQGRKPLEPWQLQDAERLRELFQKHSKLSQQAFGLAFDIGTQGAVWQYLNGHRPLNIAVARKFARGLNV